MAKNELVSLALLKISPMHAYAINSVLENMGVEHWAQISRASIYAALNRLEKQNAIAVRLEKVDNMPERKVFSITTDGEVLLREEMKKALSSVSKVENNLFHLAVNLFIGVKHDEAIAWANERITSLSKAQYHIQEEIDTMTERRCISAMITLKAAMEHVSTEINVTKEFISILQNTPDYYEKYISEFRIYMNGEILDKECK